MRTVKLGNGVKIDADNTQIHIWQEGDRIYYSTRKLANAHIPKVQRFWDVWTIWGRKRKIISLKPVRVTPGP